MSTNGERCAEVPKSIPCQLAAHKSRSSVPSLRLGASDSPPSWRCWSCSACLSPCTGGLMNHWFSRRVTCLCAQFEAVLQHGLKRSRGLALTAAAIKQAAGFTSKTETGTDAAQRMESFLKSFYLFFNSGQSGIVWEWDGGSLMVQKSTCEDVLPIVSSGVVLCRILRATCPSL